MLRFALTQTVSVALTMALVLSLVFVAMRALPGDAAAILGGLDTEQAQVESIRRELGLDRPLLAQFGSYWVALLQGDLGTSIRERRPVSRVLLDRLPVTLTLAALAFTLSLAIGVTVGFVAGRWPGTAADHAALSFTTVGLALPEFWFGFLLILFFAVQLGAFPVIGYPVEGDLVVRLWHLALPALTLAIPRSAQIARLTRARVLEEVRGDYVRTARSKGVGSFGVSRHVTANALPGVLPLLALELGGLLTGTIVVEQVFGLPGLGLALLGAIGARDYPVVQGVTILAVTIYLLVNALADVLQLLSDPRLRYE